MVTRFVVFGVGLICRPVCVGICSRDVGSGDRSGADVCIWLRTPFGWKTEFVSGNCVREAREFIPWTIRSSGLVQVNDGLYAEVPLCASGPIARRRIDLMCLEASVGRLPQEVLLEGFYRSECSETVRVGRVRVFEELQAVFNCSVLTFWSAIKFHRE
jgi:hypothetical protein